MSSLLLVVSGASRGLGQAIATAFCEYGGYRTANGGCLLTHIRAMLVARSNDGLVETRSQMQAAASKHDISLDDSIHVMDLSNLEALDDNIDVLLEEAISSNAIDYDLVVLINNAGSLGHLGPLVDMPSLKDLQDSIDFNVTSSFWLSIRFVRSIMASSKFSSSSCVVVNISSLSAVQPFPTMGIYGTGKAARDMFYNVWSKELVEQQDESAESKTKVAAVKLLNYAPGALETDMTTRLRQSAQLDPKLQTYFQNAHESGDLIPPDKTARRLIKLVLKNEFESGSHVDYWDLSDEET